MSYQDQLRGFKYHRCMLVGPFSCIKKMNSGQRESELATFDENRLPVGMLNPKRDKKIKGTYRGGRRVDTCDHGLSKTSLRVRTSYELGERVKVMIEKENEKVYVRVLMTM